jgi:hypothetical protein
MLGLFAVAPLAGCEREEGALEETGENIDQGLEDAGESVEDTAE